MPRTVTVADILALRDFPTLGGHPFDFDPSGRYLAFSLPRGAAKSSRHFLSFIGGGDADLHVLDLKSRDIRRYAMPDDLGTLSPCWSPDGEHIAVAVTDGTFLRLAIVDVRSGNVRVPLKRNLDLRLPHPMFRWRDGETVLCELHPSDELPYWMDSETRSPKASIAAWQTAWAGTQSTASRLTGDRKVEEPTTTVTYCSVHVPTGDTHAHADTEMLPEDVAAFAACPMIDYPPRCVGEHALVPPESIRVAGSTDGRQSIFLARSADATRLWLVNGDEARLVFETDTHLAEIAGGETGLLAFRTRQGRDEHLRWIRPPNHAPGERRPAVIWVYPGSSVESDFLHRQHLVNDPSWLNLHLFAALGFTVLVPSIPTDERARAGRELADCLADAVVPAVDAAVAAGFVDPDDLIVAGHSLGGWAALVLLGETDLFRGGIAIAAPTDLISKHGTSDVRLRYGDIVDDDSRARTERIFHLAGPPWEMVNRYIRNSPLFSATKIDAPVLLFHGDQDYVPLTQAEEMFSALRALGKSVELVRYWGEGHVFQSPANIADLWERIAIWLVECRRERGIRPE